MKLALPFDGVAIAIGVTLAPGEAIAVTAVVGFWMMGSERLFPFRAEGETFENLMRGKVRKSLSWLDLKDHEENSAQVSTSRADAETGKVPQYRSANNTSDRGLTVHLKVQ